MRALVSFLLVIALVPGERGGPAQSSSALTLQLRELRASDPSTFAAKVRAILEAEDESAGSLRRRLAEPASREAALVELAAAHAELGAAVRAALPAGPADEATVERALAPWTAECSTRPIDQKLQSELGLLIDLCERAERALLALAPADPPVARKAKQEAAEAWRASSQRALSAIFDLARYPDQGHGDVEQAVIDKLVGGAWSDYKAMADRIDKDLVPLYRKESEEWAALLDGDAAAARALDETRPLVAARPGVRLAPRDSGDSARMRLGRALALAYAGRPWTMPPGAEADLHASELLRHARARRVLDFNAADLARNPRDPEEDEAERWINEYRIALGRKPLEHEARLYASARGHSAEMKELDYYGHDSPVDEHKTFADRIRLAGYPESRVGECIAKGSSRASGGRIARSWYGSSTHHRLILSEEFRQIGVGRAGPYFTANFGAEHVLGD